MNLVLPGRTRLTNGHFLPDSDLAQVRLLIVEDDPFLQSYLSEILLDYPLQVFIADSIHEAVGFYLKKQPDILLMESYFSFASNPAIDKKITAGNLQLITIIENKAESRFANARPGTVFYLTKPLVPNEVTRVVISLAEGIVLKKILS